MGENFCPKLSLTPGFKKPAAETSKRKLYSDVWDGEDIVFDVGAGAKPSNTISELSGGGRPSNTISSAGVARSSDRAPSDRPLSGGSVASSTRASSKESTEGFTRMKIVEEEEEESPPPKVVPPEKPSFSFNPRGRGAKPAAGIGGKSENSSGKPGGGEGGAQQATATITNELDELD